MTRTESMQRLFKHIEQEATARLDRKLKQRASAQVPNPSDSQPSEQETAGPTVDKSTAKHTIVGQTSNPATSGNR